MLDPASLKFGKWGLDAYGSQDELKSLEGLTLFHYTKEETLTIFYFGHQPFSGPQYKIVSFYPTYLGYMKGQKITSVEVTKETSFSLTLTMENGVTTTFSVEWFVGNRTGFFYAMSGESLVWLGTFSEEPVLG